MNGRGTVVPGPEAASAAVGRGTVGAKADSLCLLFPTFLLGVRNNGRFPTRDGNEVDRMFVHAVQQSSYDRRPP